MLITEGRSLIQDELHHINNDEVVRVTHWYGSLGRNNLVMFWFRISPCKGPIKIPEEYIYDVDYPI